MSSINIQDFKSKFNAGGARPNLFQVTIPLQPWSDKLKFTCRAASLPQMTVGTIEVPYQGRKIKIAGDRTFAEWTITVLNDEDWRVRRGLERWNNALNEHLENIREGAFYNLSEYKFDVYIDQLDKQGLVIATYKMVGAFPSELSPIEVAWDTTDTIEEFTCTLQYDYWKADAVAGSEIK